MINLIRTIACSICHALGGDKPDSVTKIKPIDTIEAGLAYAILEAKLKEMNVTRIPIYVPDARNKVYKKQDVIDFLKLDETSSIQYIAEEFDCDDFAATLYGKFAGLVWTDIHALNWFIDESDNFWFIEPQTNQIAPNLDTWQGNNVRFFLGR